PLAVHVGDGPPTYDPEPTALPAADPEHLDDLVPDTALDGARYGSATLRAASVRGDSPRYRGEPRRDVLLTARFGSGDRALLLIGVATGSRAADGTHRAAADLCHWVGRAVGDSHARLSEDIGAGRRGELKSGLHRLTGRAYGRLRGRAVDQGLDPASYTARLRCLLLPADPACRTRVFFGVGEGGLFRLRDGVWQDIEPSPPDPGTATGGPVVGFGGLPGPRSPGNAPAPPGPWPPGDPAAPHRPDGSGDPAARQRRDEAGDPAAPYRPDGGSGAPAAGPGPGTPADPRVSVARPAPGGPAGGEGSVDPFLFRASVARPGDVLLLCSPGLAEPFRDEPELAALLAGRWSRPAPPGLAAFLADVQVRVKGYADDRTAAAVWEA
ncbi:protein phosphatase 2C domain-containing protein, partial [Streptomyces sp. Ru87]